MANEARSNTRNVSNAPTHSSAQRIQKLTQVASIIPIIISLSLYCASTKDAGFEPSNIEFANNKTEECPSMKVEPFVADFQSKGVEQYASIVNRDRMTLATDPSGTDRKVLKMSVRRTDIGPTDDPRAQIRTPNHTLSRCTEFWAGVSMYIPKFSSAEREEIARSRGHIMYAQIYGRPWKAAAPLRIGWSYDSVKNRHLFGVGGVGINGTSVITTDIWRINPIEERWVEIVLHMKMSTNPSEGFVEVYSDLGKTGDLTRQRLTDGSYRIRYATLNFSNFDRKHPIGNSMDLNVYRPARMRIDNVTAYFTNHRIGNSLEEVRNDVKEDD